MIVRLGAPTRPRSRPGVKQPFIRGFLTIIYRVHNGRGAVHEFSFKTNDAL